MKFIKNKLAGGNIYKFKSGDRFVTKSGDYGTIIKLARFDEFNLDFHYNDINYVVQFDKGNQLIYTNAYNVYDDYIQGYKYIMNENDIMLTTKPNTFNYSNQTNNANCNYSIGEYVKVINSFITIKPNLNQIQIINKNGSKKFWIYIWKNRRRKR